MLIMIEGLVDLDNVRFQIVKNMIAEFPELKIQITKEILVEGIQQNAPKDLKEYLSETSNSSRHHWKVSQEDHMTTHPRRYETKTFDLWAKFNMATQKNNSRTDRYYVFR